MRVPLYLQVVPIYALLLGMFSAPYVERFILHAQVQELAEITSIKSKTQGLANEVPVRLVIPSAGINLSIAEGSIDELDNTWTVQSGVANMIPVTATSFKKHERTVLYAHDRQGEFATVRNLKDGDRAYLQTENRLLIYTFRSAEIVHPTNLSVLTDQPVRPELALITCEGVLSNNRLVTYLSLEEAK